MNFLYKFKIARMSRAEVADEVIHCAAVTEGDNFEKLSYIAQVGRLDFDSVVQRIIVAGSENNRMLSQAQVALHRVMKVPGISDEQKSWALWFASPNVDLMKIMFMNKAPCPQEKKDAYLADFLTKSSASGIKLMLEQGADLDKAEAIVEARVGAEKKKLEKGSKDARQKLDASLVAIRKTAAQFKR